MNMLQHLTRINRLTEFRANPYEKEKSSWGARLGKVAAVVGGGAALAGGAGYLRGRMAMGGLRMGPMATTRIGLRNIGRDVRGAGSAVSGLFDKIKTDFRQATSAPASAGLPFGKLPVGAVAPVAPSGLPFGKAPVAPAVAAANAVAPDYRRGAERQPYVDPEIDRGPGMSAASKYMANRRERGRKYTYSMEQRLIELNRTIEFAKKPMTEQERAEIKRNTKAGMKLGLIFGGASGVLSGLGGGLQLRSRGLSLKKSALLGGAAATGIAAGTVGMGALGGHLIGRMSRKKRLQEEKGFSMKQRLIELDQLIDNPKMSRNKKIAIAAGALGAGYLGSAYYRGRKVAPDASLIDTLIAGNRLHMDSLRGGPKVAAPVAGAEAVVPPVVTGVPIRKKARPTTSTSTGGTTTVVHLPVQTLRPRKPRPSQIERFE